MMEIIILGIILLMLLAKRGRGSGRSMATYRKLAVDDVMALGGLAAKTAITIDLANVLSEERRITSAELTWTLKDLAAGEGPVVVGLCHSDYSSAEVEAWIENSGSWTEADMPSREISTRWIRQVGVFGEGAGGESLVLNDGRPIKTKLNWKLPTGQTLGVWAYNPNAAEAITTGTEVFATGHLNSFR